MRYFRKLDIDNFREIKASCHEVFAGKNLWGFELLDSELWYELQRTCPQIMTCWQQWNIEPVWAITVTTHVNADMQIHCDYQSKQKHLCRINIPILNCEHSITEYYQGGIFKHQRGQSHETGYLNLVDPEDPSCVKVTEFCLDRPTVIRVQEPHTVRINEQYSPRIALSLVMNRDPVFLL